MPFGFSMKHYQIFGETSSKMKDSALMTPESWDALREEHPNFSIPDDRQEWIQVNEAGVKKDGQDSLLKARAIDIVELLRKENIEKVFSLGVGGAGLEYFIKKLIPEVKLTCADYSHVTVERLKKVFTESDAIVEFDMLRADWKETSTQYLDEGSLCLMYRIDASFSDSEWCKIFSELYNAKVEKILIIPTGMLTMLSVYNRKSREVKWFFKKISKLLCGYVRTKKRFESYWHGLYSQKILILGGLEGFFLTRK